MMRLSKLLDRSVKASRSYRDSYYVSQLVMACLLELRALRRELARPQPVQTVSLHCHDCDGTGRTGNGMGSVDNCVRCKGRGHL